jgi:Methyltransferase domain.
VIVNYHPTTLPWLNSRVLAQSKVPNVGIMHEVTQEVADAATAELFAFHIAPDPTLLLRNPIVFKTGRLIPNCRNPHPTPVVPTIGSFGFGTSGKGFQRLVTEAQRAFDTAVIRLNIPSSFFSDQDGSRARAIAEDCHRLAVKPGIQIEIRHDFMSDEGLLNFLGQNSLNAFLYEYQGDRGLASVIDYALAVQRPIAVTKSSMFRHVCGVTPAITIEDSSLSDILARGVAPLSRCRMEWTSENLVWDYERIVGEVLGVTGRDAKYMSFHKAPLHKARIALRATARRLLSSVRQVETILVRSETSRNVLLALKSQPTAKKAFTSLKGRLAGTIPANSVRTQSDWTLVADRAGGRMIRAKTIPSYNPAAVPAEVFNRILDDTAARSYRPAIDYLFQHMPELMARRTPAANVQQAFVLDAVVRFVAGNRHPVILSIGDCQDVVVGCLQRSGYAVEEVDPLVNYALSMYMTKPTCRRSSFDVVFAASTIEHVANDGQFLKEIEELLIPGGIAILTCDFNDHVFPGGGMLTANRRLYSRRDILDRLVPMISRCELVDSPKWDRSNLGVPCGKYRHTFASLVFRRAT